ncbi:MAG: outer membrane beta-barrel protein [Bryobacterales bacterium]|nr:outer membrane beta-barrel protein [Bryobacterales bacterium]MDE0264104.1 outer membrane beta-barrel protein [Bryobacterales bacterium]
MHRSCVLLQAWQRGAEEGESAAGRIDGLSANAEMGRRVFSLAAAAILTVCASEAAAQTGMYVQMDMGATMAPQLAVDGSDNDWSTKCDLIINPLGLETGSECDTAPPRTSWSNEFDGAAGVSAGVALGYDWGAVRLEGEYFHRITAYNAQSDLGIFDDVTLDKREQEIELAVGIVDDLRSHDVFANMYYDFGSSSFWTPYVGAGIGLERATLDYGTIWKRNDDPQRIATFSDPALRAKVAGTTTIGDARLTDVTLGYQLLAGVDYRLRETVTLGMKFRWTDFGEFVSEPTPWNQLRSHESSVGRGETILYQIATEDSSFWGVSLSLKYWF